MTGPTPGHRNARRWYIANMLERGYSFAASQEACIFRVLGDYLDDAAVEAAELLSLVKSGQAAVERELTGLLEGCCLLDNDLNPRRDTLEVEYEGEAQALEAAIERGRIAIAKLEARK